MRERKKGKEERETDGKKEKSRLGYPSGTVEVPAPQHTF